jgi:hypothetical protein
MAWHGPAVFWQLKCISFVGVWHTVHAAQLGAALHRARTVFLVVLPPLGVLMLVGHRGMLVVVVVLVGILRAEAQVQALANAQDADIGLNVVDPIQDPAALPAKLKRLPNNAQPRSMFQMQDVSRPEVGTDNRGAQDTSASLPASTDTGTGTGADSDAVAHKNSGSLRSHKNNPAPQVVVQQPTPNPPVDPGPGTGPGTGSGSGTGKTQSQWFAFAEVPRLASSVHLELLDVMFVGTSLFVLLLVVAVGVLGVRLAGRLRALWFPAPVAPPPGHNKDD